MNFRYRKIAKPVALLVTLAVGQLYIAAGFADSNRSTRVSESRPAEASGILSTTNSKAITVNGASAITGASIPSGATIETPAGVGATIKIAGMGTICIAPNSKVIVEFDQGNIKVTVVEGCGILKTLKNTGGVVTSAQGNLGQIDAATGGAVDVCSRTGQAPTINQGAAADAGAGASALDCGAAGAAAAPGGIPLPATIALFAGGATGLFFLFRGDNPSPSNP